MTKSTLIWSDVYFVCEICGNTFKEKALADKCEEHCNKHRKHNPELTALAAKCPG